MCIICSYYTVAHEVIRLEFANYILRIATFISILSLRTTYHLAMPKTRLLSVIFNNSIQPFEINLFRGAIGNVMREGSVLFHNHLEGGLRYGYPLIQYKIINKKAAIVCLEEGADAVYELLGKGNLKFQLGERVLETFQVEEFKNTYFDMKISETKQRYSINNWLALNSDNIKKFKDAPTDWAKIELLESVLTGNILSMAKGLGWKVESRIETRIMEVEDQYPLTHKNQSFEAFNLIFSSNVSLPSFIGLGKGASSGHGTIRIKKNVKTI